MKSLIVNFKYHILILTEEVIEYSLNEQYDISRIYQYYLEKARDVEKQAAALQDVFEIFKFGDGSQNSCVGKTNDKNWKLASDKKIKDKKIKVFDVDPLYFVVQENKKKIEDAAIKSLQKISGVFVKQYAEELQKLSDFINESLKKVNHINKIY
jgi:hypothetical protein